MTLKSALLILCNVLYQVQCDDQNSTEPELEYNEFRLKHGDPLDYEAFIKKVLDRNTSTTSEVFGKELSNYESIIGFFLLFFLSGYIEDE